MKVMLRRSTLVLMCACIAALFFGVWGFQREQADLQVEGYLDPAQRIYYVGGHVPDSNDTFFVDLAWHSSPATLEEIDYYVQASRDAGKRLIEDGVTDFYVGVTLRRYLSPAEFEELSSALGLKVTEFAMRASFPKIDPDTRISIFGMASADHLIDPTNLDRTMEGLRFQAREKKADKIAAQRTGDAEIDWASVTDAQEFKGISIDDGDAIINGIYTFEAITDVRGYQRLLEDPRVFHVDVTATLVFEQLKTKGITWEEFVKMPNLGDYDPFWSMETLGLDKFKAK